MTKNFDSDNLMVLREGPCTALHEAKQLNNSTINNSLYDKVKSNTFEQD